MNPDLLEKVCIPPEIDAVLRQGASLMLSVSGGKDSDSLTELLPILRHAYGWTGPIFLAYADLQGSDWLMTHAYVRQRATELGLPLYVVTRPQGTLLEHMHDRHRKRPDAPPFPSPSARYCTSDHKQGPTNRLWRRLLPSGFGVCAMGIRAEESRTRARKPIFQRRESVCTRTRTVYDWHPVFNFTEADIWATLGVRPQALAQYRERVRRLQVTGSTWQCGFRCNFRIETRI